MNKNYTQYNSDSIYQFLDEDDTTNAIDFIKDPSNFRSFNQGLSEIMIKKGYVTEGTSLNDMANLLFKKLSEIGSSIPLRTVTSWIIGETSPNIEYRHRNQMYEICFALNLTFEETVWFFHHVYYDRAFNCHTINDSVYYFCFKNNLPYRDAINIKNEIEKAPINESAISKTSNYTLFIQQHIEDIKSPNELIAFLTHNKCNFSSWNKSAYETLKYLENELLPTKEGKKELEKVKRKIKNKNSSYGIIPQFDDQKNLGLIMKEILFDYPDESFIEIIEEKNTGSTNFLLEQILGMKLNLEKGKKRFIDENSIPNIIKHNFPSRKIMSDVLSEDKISQTKTYDSIRKVIILLYFYRFWCEIKITNQSEDCNNYALSDIFIDEINDLLYSCGYENIYPGNPYDWIFIRSAQVEDPLAYFRELVSYLLVE